MHRLGIYIHVPFCLSKCPYCDFYSLAVSDSSGDEDKMDAYVSMLCSQLAWFSKEYPGYRADTVYFGGGTPVLLGAKRLGRILQAVRGNFSLVSGAEITLEANPCLMDEAVCRELLSAGFNRISIGVQSLQEEELALLGRRHDGKTALAALDAAKNAGFGNISADLMLATPGQTPGSLSRTLDILMETPVTHISAYLLKVEPGTPYYSMAASGIITVPDEDTVAQCYQLCVKRLTGEGFLQYEISNFAEPGYECRHNLKYWQCGEYLGLGPHAHSFMNGRRFDFNATLAEYSELWKEEKFPMHENGPGGDLEEKLMLGLRLNQGVDLSGLNRDFGAELSPLLKKSREYERHGLMKTEGSRIFLTPEGFLVSNSIISGLLALL